MHYRGGVVRGSVLGRGVHVQSGSLVEDSIVLDNCIIGRQCKIRRTIVDENVTLADGVSVGYDLEQDRARHHVTETGIVVVTSRSADRMIVHACTENTAA
jgi:glucose-1-phosphate adenylyltransferase